MGPQLAAPPAPQLEFLVATVAEARRRFARGEAVDLARLAADAAAALADRSAGRARLLALQDELEQLLVTVEREHQSAARLLGHLAAHGRAGRAYGAQRM